MMKLKNYLNEAYRNHQLGNTAEIKPIALKPDVKKKINKKIYTLTSKYSAQIPLQDIFSILGEYDIIAVDEAGEPWQGFLTGRDGEAHFDLRDTGSNAAVKNSMLLLQWHKMESGSYEIVCYIT